jgi:hypothetical protein
LFFFPVGIGNGEIDAASKARRNRGIHAVLFDFPGTEDADEVPAVDSLATGHQCRREGPTGILIGKELIPSVSGFHPKTTGANWRARHCYTRVDSWFDYFHRFNPHWLVDRPEAGGGWHQLWQFGFGGLNPGDQITVEAGSAGTIRAFASDAGAAKISAVINAESLSLMREPGHQRHISQ